MVERSGGAATSPSKSTSMSRWRSMVASCFERDRVVGGRAQVLAPLLARDGVEIRVDALHRPEPDQELGRRLVADAGHPRDVVRGVALEADEVGHELGADAVALDDPLGRVDHHVRHPPRRHHDADVLGGELERVPVGRDHADLVAGRLRLRGERADDVVGLLAGDAQIAIAERLDDRLEVRHLLAEQVGHRPAVRLVLGVEFDARGRLLVPGHEHGRRAVVGQELHQHVRHPEQRVRREPVHRLQLLRQGEEGAVGKAVAVDQEDVALLGRRVVEVQILRLSLLDRGHPSQRIRGRVAQARARPLLFARAPQPVGLLQPDDARRDPGGGRARSRRSPLRSGRPTATSARSTSSASPRATGCATSPSRPRTPTTASASSTPCASCPACGSPTCPTAPSSCTWAARSRSRTRSR